MARKIGWVVPLVLVAVLALAVPAQADSGALWVAWTASPTEGYAPLTVNIYPDIDGVSYPPYTVVVDWDDGNIEDMGQFESVPDINAEVFAHEYTSAGTYSASVSVIDNVGVERRGWGSVITVTEFCAWCYDSNEDGVIHKLEVLAAVVDYFDYRITKLQALQVVALYFNTNK